MNKGSLVGRLSLVSSILTGMTALAIGGLSAYLSSRALIDAEYLNLQRNAADYAEQISLYLESADSVVTTFAAAGSEALLAPGTPIRELRANSVASHLLTSSPAFEYTEIVDASGAFVSVEPAELRTNLVRPNIGAASWFTEAQMIRGNSFSDLLISNVTRRPTILISRALRDASGRFLGVIAGGIKMARLSTSLLGKKIRPDEASGYLTDSRGLIIAHQTEPLYVLSQTDFSSSAPVILALRGESGTLRYESQVDGLEKFGAYLPFIAGSLESPRRWALVFRISTITVLNPALTLALYLGGVVLGLGALLVFANVLLLRRTLRPIGGLILAAQTMGTGDLTARAPTGLKYEIGELAEAFDHMAASIESAETDMVAESRRLEVANLSLESSNRELEAYSYSVAHDLRTPLRAIDGFSKAIAEDYGHLLRDEGKMYLGFLQEAAQRMGTLIDDILHLASYAHTDLVRADVDLSGLAARLGAELSKAEREKGRVPEFRIQAGMRDWVDERLFSIALGNLFENAIKFSQGEKPIVEFSSGIVDGAESFHIRDSGVGFDMRYADKLFRPFSRLHSDSSIKGTGIGLATVQRIIARHGGRIWAESAPGQGATFSFTLGKEART